jgi:hypothetical protein
MLNSWMKRWRRGRTGRGRTGWLARIDGVEKPALLLGLGLVLYRVWRNGGEPNATFRDRGRALADRTRGLKDRWRATVARMRRKMGGQPSDAGLEGDPPPPAPPPA